MKKLKWAMCDFETTTTNPTRVWVYGIMSSSEKSKKIGYDIKDFMHDVNKYELAFFHNLRFDGNFIENYLFRAGFLYVNSKPNELNPGQFTTLISDMGMYFMLAFKTETGLTIIRDSYKLIPLPVRAIPKAFGLDIEKTSFNYGQANFNSNKKLDADGEKYLMHDIIIVNRGLKIFFEISGKEKFTQASTALSEFKDLQIGFKTYFPKISIPLTKYMLRAYRGGWVYVKPDKSCKTLQNMQVFDINSMYPTQMKYAALPIGEPVRFNGSDYDTHKNDLYIADFHVKGYLKQGHLPTLQIKGDHRYKGTEYVSNILSDTLITLTNVDVELMLKHYELTEFECIGGFLFDSKVGLFDEYLDKFMTMKEEAGKSGNLGMRFIAKIYLNSLYGKFGSNPVKRGKYPFMDADGSVKYRLGDEEETQPVYAPIAVFITAYARKEIITAAQDNYDNFVYADTDSLHMIKRGDVNLKIDSQKLGYWKEESHENGFVKRGKFIRAKTYVEEYGNGKLNVKAAGLPALGKKEVTFENFRIGATYGGKLMPKHVPGGTLLVETDFTIK